MHDEVNPSVGSADSMNKTVTEVAAHTGTGSNEELVDTLAKNVNTNKETFSDIDRGVFIGIFALDSIPVPFENLS